MMPRTVQGLGAQAGVGRGARGGALGRSKGTTGEGVGGHS